MLNPPPIPWAKCPGETRTVSALEMYNGKLHVEYRVKGCYSCKSLEAWKRWAKGAERVNKEVEG